MQIWHNPRCSKSRNAKTILEDNNCDFEVVDYLKKTLFKEDIKALLTMLDISDIREILRTKEDAYKENNLTDTSLSQDQIIEIVIKNPKLIERPIIIKDGKAIIARPPELALEFIK